MARRSDVRPCDLCGRTMLPGEPCHYFDEPERGRRLRVVCALCRAEALARGWVRSPDGSARDR